MSTPDQRARDKDRDAAIEIVEAAWADGQIIEADRDKRVEELLRAQTLGEITMLTHDLQPGDPAPSASVAPVAPITPITEIADGMPLPAPANPPYSTPDVLSTSASAGQRKPSRAMFVVPLVVVALVLGGVGVGIAALVHAVSDSVDGIDLSGPSGQTYAPGIDPEGDDVNVLSEQGYDDLVDAIEAANGSDQAFSAVLYPTYAVLDLPVDATSQRESSWYWNGDLEQEDGMTGTSSDARFALRSVDPAVFVALVKKVRGLVDDPTSWYAVLGAPGNDRTMIWVYASNEYAETAYLAARRNGTITYDSTNP